MGYSSLAGMPDMAARVDLEANRDPAGNEHLDIDAGEIAGELGKVQEAILRALRAITITDDSVVEEQLGWIQYGEIPDAVVQFGYVGSTENAHRAAVSRSVRSLAERKLVAGAVREWSRYYGMDTTADEPNELLSYGEHPWREFDDERTDNPTPTIAYVRLTTRGHAVADYLDVNQNDN
jgi:hypothetical protein